MSNTTSAPDLSGFPAGAYRANLYVHEAEGRIDWYAIAEHSFIEGRAFTIGRAPDCNIILADGAVSGRHACIRFDGAELVVTDLGSTNGVTVNDVPTPEAVLQHGDVIRIGSTDIRFLYAFKSAPVQLVLDFTEGPNAGKSISTFGSSVTIGRLNCTINLPGADVAPQHARVDAYGTDLIYVVNLRRGNEMSLRGERVTGISGARDRDVLKVAGHVMRLRVVDSKQSMEAAAAIPVGQGTLQVVESEPAPAKAPIAALMISGDDLARIEAAHARATSEDPAPGDADLTAFEMAPLGDTFDLPTERRDEVLRPAPTLEAASAKRNHDGSRHPAARAPRPTPRHTRPLWPWVLAVPMLMLAGATLALKIIRLPRSESLTGEVAPGSFLPTVSPVRGRIDQILVPTGQRIGAREGVLRLLDLDVHAELERLAAQIETAQRAPLRLGVVERVAPPVGLVDALRRDERALLTARLELEDLTAAFNRRESTFAQLQAAQAKEADLTARVQRLDSSARAATVLAKGGAAAGPDLEVVRHLGQLIAERESLEARRYVLVEAARAGVLMPRGPPEATPLQVGLVVERDETIFIVADVSRVAVRLRVTPTALPNIVSVGRAIVTPEGFTEPRVPVELGPPSVVAEADGSFVFDTLVENPQGVWRTGQRVRAQVTLPSVDGLSWLSERL